MSCHNSDRTCRDGEKGEGGRNKRKKRLDSVCWKMVSLMEMGLRIGR